MNKHKRPKYTLEIKQDAVKLVNEKGYRAYQLLNYLHIRKIVDTKPPVQKL
ncbi:MAG: hypothetical protein Q7T96_14000 [Methylobacter sp.]|nr:hypothetical protein [Methylobacter sp.]